MSTVSDNATLRSNPGGTRACFCSEDRFNIASNALPGLPRCARPPRSPMRRRSESMRGFHAGAGRTPLARLAPARHGGTRGAPPPRRTMPSTRFLRLQKSSAEAWYREGRPGSLTRICSRRGRGAQCVPGSEPIARTRDVAFCPAVPLTHRGFARAGGTAI